MATADGAPTFRLRIGTWPGTRYRCSFGSRSRGGLAAQRCVPPRGALGGRHERARRAAGRGYGGRRAAHRRPPLAGAPGFGWRIGRGHGRARPRRRGARQLRGAGPGQGQPPCAQQPGRAMIRHRKCAATDARKAGSLCSSSVLLGVSLARRLAVRNLRFRVAARLPALCVACTTGGGSQAACVCRGSSFSTRRRSAAIIISICLDSRHWLSLLVCVLVQVIYGVSGVSGHFGDVVLWELNPPAAGEVLIRAGGHPRLLCGWQLGSHSCDIARNNILTSQHPLRFRCRR